MYLRDAYRVLRSGGKVVFSFLEFRIPGHWRSFEHALAKESMVHIQFLSRDAITAWSEHLGYHVDGILDGDSPQCRLGSIGQSVCVCSKP